MKRNREDEGGRKGGGHGERGGGGAGEGGGGGGGGGEGRAHARGRARRAAAPPAGAAEHAVGLLAAGGGRPPHTVPKPRSSAADVAFVVVLAFRATLTRGVSGSGVMWMKVFWTMNSRGVSPRCLAPSRGEASTSAACSGGASGPPTR